MLPNSVSEWKDHDWTSFKKICVSHATKRGFGHEADDYFSYACITVLKRGYTPLNGNLFTDYLRKYVGDTRSHYGTEKSKQYFARASDDFDYGSIGDSSDECRPDIIFDRHEERREQRCRLMSRLVFFEGNEFDVLVLLLNGVSYKITSQITSLTESRISQIKSKFEGFVLCPEKF